jgi:hypothetical protein
MPESAAVRHGELMLEGAVADPERAIGRLDARPRIQPHPRPVCASPAPRTAPAASHPAPPERMAGKYAGAVISGPEAMAAAQDAREFLSANYPNLQFQLEVDMTQLREGEIKLVIDIKGVRF